VNVLILTAMRSGSTYLFNMLRDTGHFNFPSPQSSHPSLKSQHAVGEFFAPNHNLDPWDTLGVPKSREMCIQNLKLKANQPFKHPALLKVLKEQFEYYMLDHTDRPLIESLFPDTKYIWLERKDIFARAVSAYQFFVSKTPHLWTQDMKRKYDSTKIPFDAKGVQDVFYNHVKDCDWSSFLEGAAHHYVEYEDLVSKPQLVLTECMMHLGYPIQVSKIKEIVDKQPKFKTERLETKEHIERLKRSLVKML
jgi:LPS sulfotransferase NodH